MTVFWTIFAGVCVYVTGQLILRFVIEPVHQQRETIGRITDFLIYHANRYTSTGLHLGNSAEELNETKELARTLASELMVRTQAIPGYTTLERLRLAPKRTSVRRAQEGLFTISNSMFDIGSGLENFDEAEAIEQALGIVTEFQIGEEARPAEADTEPD